MASNITLLLLLLAAIASTIAEMDESEQHIDPASTIAELLKAAVTSTIAELDEPADCDGYGTYIVMLEPPEGGQDAGVDAARALHRSFLPSVTTAQGKPRLLHSYRTVFTGFAAWLTQEELEVSSKPGFVRSFDNNIYR
ncbi:subtilisin-like protease 4 [Aegilops tauschii subsp. strangulata]|uniref:Inhibitor I9 domain-containing protein n=2 Tax=Aegilops tauschii TaxID=37682 RepID=A0A452Z9X9_AEGTS|nr:subtilisin-like protease [Aegilops tauschii subsp. strangulata]